MYFLRTSIVSSFLLSMALCANAQNCVRQATDFVIHFRVDKSVLDPYYMGTEASLRAMSDSITRMGADRIDSLEIISYASPEGRYAHNTELSKRRLAAINSYIISHHANLASKIKRCPVGESWPLFRMRLLTDTLSTGSISNSVLSMIDADEPSDLKKSHLKKLDGGRVFSYFIRNYFDSMRYSKVRVMWSLPVLQPVGGYDYGFMFPQSALLAAPVFAATALPVKLPVEWREKKTILAVKTNLLYDLFTALNVEVEVPIGRNFSIAVEDVFPWWSWGPHDRKYCFQMWEMGIEPRWWFKRTDSRSVLSGQFAGFYVMSSKYDFQWNNKACYQGEFWSAGFTYGYAMKLSRRFNMEFSASVGYLLSDYRHYVPSDDYGHLYRDRYKTGSVGYFGLTKLKASLVYPINVTVRHREGRRDE